MINFTACQGKTNEKIKTEETMNTATFSDKNETDETGNIAFSGKVFYSTQNSACFFVDPEMIKQEITDGLGDKAESGTCTNPTYGNGVPVIFSELDKNSDYPTPPTEDVLVIIKGYWKTETYQGKENIAVFYVKEYQPFF